MPMYIQQLYPTIMMRTPCVQYTDGDQRPNIKPQMTKLTPASNDDRDQGPYRGDSGVSLQSRWPSDGVRVGASG